MIKHLIKRLVERTKDSFQTLLSVNGLRISFSDAGRTETVLRGIDLQVFPGETLGIVGESGSGKTLAALALGGLLPPAARFSCDAFSWRLQNGTVLDLTGMKRESFEPLRGREIAYIFQDPGASLNPVLSCGEQIAEVLRKHLGMSFSDARKQALEWLARVHLPEPERIFRSFPHELSGGQKQRVMIASALCIQPRLLIADEPTTSLDATVQRHMLDLLKSLRRELGLTMVFISHDLDIIGEMADRVMVLKEGDVVEQRATKELFQSPAHPYTQKLLNARLTELPKVEPCIQQASLPLLKVEDLRAGFRVRSAGLFKADTWLKALDGVDLCLAPGETLGIVGESGSGKSTLARALLGLIPVTSGRILYDNHDYAGAQAKQWIKVRRAMQIVFQDPFTSLNPRQRVGEALMEPLLVHDPAGSWESRRSRVSALLHKVGLSEKYLTRYPHELSGGQRQRVSIARALMPAPEILICDEPVTALDVSVQAMVLGLLRNLQEELGLSYIFISHDLASVAFMSHRIMVMKDGRVVESGLTGEVLGNPADPYTAELLSAIPKPLTKS